MTVEQKQCLLYFMGYYDGKIDGIWGNRSKEATEAFQRDFMDHADGIFGQETEDRIRQAVGNYDDLILDVPSGGTFWDEIEYFDRSEFKCTCGGKYCNGFPVEPDEKLVRTVNQIRKHFGKPFTPNSAIRCSRRNAEVGGVSDSQHLNGTAVDITVPGVAPQTVAAYAETLLPNTGGIGIYSWGIHVDTRKTKSRWNG